LAIDKTPDSARVHHILITNDDGVHAPGLLALKRALDQVGHVTVFAPDHNWSAAGHSKTMHKPLRVGQALLLDGTLAMTTTGAPSDCVGMAMLGLVDPLPDLVVSGINQGPNLGHDITYSGTVAAAMEAVISGVPAIAVSLDTFDPASDFEPAARFAARLSRKVLEEGLPPDTFLNVNLPPLPEDQLRGVVFTRLGKRLYHDDLIRRQDPKGHDYFWIGGSPPSGIIEDGTDFGSVANGFISVTPIDMDMTHYQFLSQITGWAADLGRP
jgi:5'-nucleotidase